MAASALKILHQLCELSYVVSVCSLYVERCVHTHSYTPLYNYDFIITLLCVHTQTVVYTRLKGYSYGKQIRRKDRSEDSLSQLQAEREDEEMRTGLTETEEINWALGELSFSHSYGNYTFQEIEQK